MTPWHPPAPHYRATVILALAALILLMLLAALFPARIVGAPSLLRSCVIAIALVIAAVAVTARLPVPLRTTLRAAGIIGLVSFLFGAISGAQHLLFPGWFDEELIRFEKTFTGIESSHLLERFIHPALTEWLMLSYVIYIPLLPFTVWVCYHYAGERAAYEYLFALLGVNLLCDAGFVLYPIASQLFYDPVQYDIPLTGGPFTAMAEWIRTNQHYPGGSFPSPHNAAGTVILMTLWRHHRGWCTAFLPFLASIPFATVYGRFHYISDAVVGIICGIALIAIADAMRGLPSAAHFPAQHRLFPSPRLLSWRTSCKRLSPEEPVSSGATSSRNCSAGSGICAS